MSGTLPVDQMKTSNGKEPSSMKTACGDCGTANPGGGQFCAGCGHSLSEPCAECAKTVLLTQAFCGSCGCDLVDKTEQKIAALENKVALAIKVAEEKDFDQARALLTVVARENDYRFKSVVAKSKQVQEKIESVARLECATAAERMAAAQQEDQAGNCAQVVELLGTLSPKLLSKEANTSLQRSRIRINQLEQAERSLQAAFQKRDWSTSGRILDQLMELKPDDDSVAQLALKVGRKLITKAASFNADHDNLSAFEWLQGVPSNARSGEYDELLNTVECTLWLASQFDHEPFATPVLGRLAKQWVEQSGADPKAVKMLERISVRIKATKESPRDLFATLDASLQSWTGGPIGCLAFPKCIDLGEHTKSIASPGQFHVAIGLALQGLGCSRVSEDFLPVKKGLLQRLGKKKAVRCWGLDIGASGLKAVCLEAVETGRHKLVDCYKLPFEIAISRSIDDAKADDTLRESIAKFLTDRDIATTPVWASFSARELISRFVTLPPVADKLAKPLLDKEIESTIPFGRDEVVTVNWISPMPAEPLASLGRPSFSTAANKQVIDRVIKVLGEAGLTLGGLQATPIALLNFAALEFAELLDVAVDADRELNPERPAVAIVECGAEVTTVLKLSGTACSFRSFESGGNEFTRLISRETKTTHSDAETLKRNPASLPRPHVQYQAVEQRLDELRSRIAKAMTDAALGPNDFDIRQTWCCGGGTLTHGWIQRVLCKK